MSDDKQTAEVAEKESESGVSLLREQGINIEELTSELDEFDGEIPMSSGYFSPEVGEINLCYFIGHDRINPAKDNAGNVESEDGLIAAVRLLMRDGTVKVSSATGLVRIIEESAVPTLVSDPTGKSSALKIVLAEKIKKGSRTFFRWEVSRLKKNSAAK